MHADEEPPVMVTEENVKALSNTVRATPPPTADLDDTVTSGDEADDDGGDDRALSVPVIILIVAGCAALVGLFAAFALLYNTALLVRRRPGQQGGGGANESAAAARELPDNVSTTATAESDTSDNAAPAAAAAAAAPQPSHTAEQITLDDVPFQENLTAAQRSTCGNWNDPSLLAIKHDGHAIVQRSAFATSMQSYRQTGSDQLPEIRSILELETGSMHAAHMHTTETTEEGGAPQLPHPTPPATGATTGDFAVRTGSHSVSTMEPASLSQTGASLAANQVGPSQARSSTLQDTARSTAQRAPSSGGPSSSHASAIGTLPARSSYAAPNLNLPEPSIHVAASTPPQMGDVPQRPQSPHPPYSKLAAATSQQRLSKNLNPPQTPVYRPPSDSPSLPHPLSMPSSKTQNMPGTSEITSSLYKTPDLSLRNSSARTRSNLMRILPLDDEDTPSHLYTETLGGAAAAGAAGSRRPPHAEGSAAAAAAFATSSGPQQRYPSGGGGMRVDFPSPAYPASSTPPDSPRISIHPPISPPSSRANSDSRGNAYTPQQHDTLKGLVLRPPGPWGPQDPGSHPQRSHGASRLPQSSAGFLLSPTMPPSSVDMHGAEKSPSLAITSEQRAQLRTAVQELLREGSVRESQEPPSYVTNIEELLPKTTYSPQHRRSSSHKAAQSFYYAQRPSSHHSKPPNSSNDVRSAKHASSRYDTCTHSVNSSDDTTNTYRITSPSSGGSMRTTSGGLPGTDYVISQRPGQGGLRKPSSEGSPSRFAGKGAGSGAAAAAQPPLPQPPLPLPPLEPSTLRGVSAAYRANHGLALARSEGRSTMSIPGLNCTSSSPPSINSRGHSPSLSSAVSPNPRPASASHSQTRNHHSYMQHSPIHLQPQSFDFPADRSSAGGTSILLSLPASNDGSVASAAASPSASTRQATALVASGYYNNSSPGLGGALGAASGPHSVGARGYPRSIGGPSYPPSKSPSSWGGPGGSPSSRSVQGGSSCGTRGFFTPGSMGEPLSAPKEFDFGITQPPRGFDGGGNASKPKRSSTGGIPGGQGGGGSGAMDIDTTPVLDLRPPEILKTVDFQPGESRYPELRPFSFPTAEPSRRDESTQVFEKRRSHGRHRRSHRHSET